MNNKVHLQVYLPGSIMTINNMDRHDSEGIINGFSTGMLSGQMLISASGAPFQYAIRINDVAALCAIPAQFAEQHGAPVAHYDPVASGKRIY